MATIYTIGYTSFSIDVFVEVLKENGITCLIDVRSVPQSSYYSDYNKENLIPLLKKAGIVYRNYKDEFGARQDDRKYYNEKGYLDFSVFAASEVFGSGIKKINSAHDLKYTVCLMCAEKDPINCHRAILVARELSKNGYEIKHILSDKGLCTQKDLEKRLLEEFFPKREQLSIFESDNLSEDQLIEKAYRLKNEEIGFRLEEEE